MQNQNRKSLMLCLILQMGITALYTVGLAKLVFNGFYSKDRLEVLLKLGVRYLPLFFILVFSMLPQLTLLIKHKLHSQDGEILPVLFLVLSFQASIITFDAVDAFDYVFYMDDYLLYVERFSFLGSAALFLLSSLRYHGFVSSAMGRITAAFLSFPLILATMTPISSYRGVMQLNGSKYEVYLAIAEICLYAAAIITFIVVAFKDGTPMNIRRAISFLLLIVGVFLARFNDLYMSIASVVLYIPGAIILTHTAGDSI